MGKLTALLSDKEFQDAINKEDILLNANASDSIRELIVVQQAIDNHFTCSACTLQACNICVIHDEINERGTHE